MKNHPYLIFALIWIAVMAVSFALQCTELKAEARNIAHKQVDEFFATVNLLRHWESLHRHDSAADPLQNSDKACLAREFAEIAGRKTGIGFHLSSLNPLDANNRADSWETAALKGFRASESHEAFFNADSSIFYQYMSPWQLDEACTGCHVQAGPSAEGHYGGVRVTVPASMINRSMTKEFSELLLIYVLIALSGLLAVLAVFFANRNMLRRLGKAKRQLKLAYLDVLTQLPNRRYYDFFVNKAWKQAMRQAYPLSIIMIDIDFFKSYNDKLGHPQGDACLQQVAKTLKLYSRRAGDLIARYGGEEFCVVAACDAEQVRELAEILRKSVELMELPHPGSIISPYVTVSLGTATVVPAENLTFEELLSHADKCLYKAKENGRNRVESCVWEAAPPPVLRLAS